MTEEKQKKHMEAQAAQKDVEFYAAAVAGWLNTRLEHDKSLLTLSAGGSGLLITLLTTVGVSSAEGLVLHLLAMFSFLVCLGAVLVIFKKNSSHIEEVLKSGMPPLDPILTKLDNISLAAFVLGIVFSLVIGVSAAINSYSIKEKEMEKANNQKSGANKSVCAADSVNGFSSLKQTGKLNKSFNGVSNLKPVVPQGTSTTTPSATQPTAPAVTQTTNNKK
jgi:hypothetical protein